MQPTSSMKEEFLQKWQMGLQIYRPLIDNTSVSERRKAIKLSADVAMASLRRGTTCWSRALIQKTATEDNFLERKHRTRGHGSEKQRATLFIEI
ncbi:hypothetical protein F2Q68_00029165 [Brassica cretica]|uniref:IBH1-like N-terminal domain-containing protein n=1 Tax=Brassica cretica TaxID=69181 RepID=A0A8S9G633_BRACR|nr:hypothetical protein F2Q68_00029165 [Brassica cretica]